MAEELVIDKSGGKESIYHSLNQQVAALLEGETDEVANMANFCAAVQTAFNHLWTGIYRVHGEELVLGPFQGPIACTRIGKSVGVCGTAWSKNETILVPDVDQFPGHIACSSLSRSEIVVPIRKESEVIGVLDVDSQELNAFDESDKEGLEMLVRTLEKQL